MLNRGHNNLIFFIQHDKLHMFGRLKSKSVQDNLLCWILKDGKVAICVKEYSCAIIRQQHDRL